MRRKGNITQEHNVKIFNKILANQIQQCIRTLILHKHVGFIPGTPDWGQRLRPIITIYCINRLKKKNRIIILIDARKLFDKPTPAQD